MIWLYHYFWHLETCNAFQISDLSRGDTVSLRSNTVPFLLFQLLLLHSAPVFECFLPAPVHIFSPVLDSLGFQQLPDTVFPELEVFRDNMTLATNARHLSTAVSNIHPSQTEALTRPQNLIRWT